MADEAPASKGPGPFAFHATRWAGEGSLQPASPRTTRSSARFPFSVSPPSAGGRAPCHGMLPLRAGACNSTEASASHRGVVAVPRGPCPAPAECAGQSSPRVEVRRANRNPWERRWGGGPGLSARALRARSTAHLRRRRLAAPFSPCCADRSGTAPLGRRRCAVAAPAGSRRSAPDAGVGNMCGRRPRRPQRGPQGRKTKTHADGIRRAASHFGAQDEKRRRWQGGRYGPTLRSA